MTYQNLISEKNFWKPFEKGWVIKCHVIFLHKRTLAQLHRKLFFGIISAVSGASKVWMKGNLWDPQSIRTEESKYTTHSMFYNCQRWPRSPFRVPTIPCVTAFLFHFPDRRTDRGTSLYPVVLADGGQSTVKLLCRPQWLNYVYDDSSVIRGAAGRDICGQVQGHPGISTTHMGLSLSITC